MSHYAAFWKIGRFVYSNLDRSSRFILLALLLTSLLQLAALVGLPIMSGKIIDAMVAGYRDDLFRWIGFVAAVGSGLILVSFAAAYFHAVVQERSGMCLRAHVLNVVLKQRADFFRDNWVGDIISRITSDSKAIQGYLTQYWIQVFLDLLTLIVVLILLWRIDAWLTMIPLALAPILFIAVHKQSRNVEQKTQEIRQSWGQISDRLQTWLSQPQMLKVFGMEKEANERFGETNQMIYSKTLVLAKIQAVLGMLSTSVTFLPSMVILAVGGLMVLEARMSVGDVFVFLQFSGYFLAPLQRLLGMKIAFPTLVSPYERLREYESSENYEPQAVQNMTKNFNLEYLAWDQLSVKFPQSEKTFAIADITLERGHVLGIKGSNGSGKSTFLKFLAGHGVQDSGKVYVNNHELSEAFRLRQWAAYLPQEAVVFPGSIAENLTLFGRYPADENRLRQVCNEVGLGPWLQKQKDGLDEILNPNFAFSSGGELQKLNLARLLLSDHNLLLFDEAGKNLDKEGKGLFLGLIGNFRAEGRIQVVVSHDADILHTCDHIIELNPSPFSPAPEWQFQGVS